MKLGQVFTVTLYRRKRPYEFIHEKKMTKWVQKLCIPIRSVVQNPHCHFSMDEPIGSFSPVQGDSRWSDKVRGRLTWGG